MAHGDKALITVVAAHAAGADAAEGQALLGEMDQGFIDRQGTGGSLLFDLSNGTTSVAE